jgi:5-methylcytosine-specific restriction endonuclease McrA
MPEPKIEVVGSLRFTEEDGLQYSFTFWMGSSGFDRRERTSWKEALPDADWPGLGRCPERPKTSHSTRAERLAVYAAQKEWRRLADAYYQALHSNPSYRQTALEFVERQRREPQSVDHVWLYRDKSILVTSSEPPSLRVKDAEALLVKHFVLRQQRNYDRVRREVEALENLERLQGTPREPIPEAVRLFVWQRDAGQCVKCSSRERIEFDHIIPIAAGGSSTERNVQLLCESCNRSKGATI